VKASRTLDRGQGLLVDFDANGAAIGIEITAPSAITVSDVNEILVDLGLEPIPAEEWSPMLAA
jgi:uncharacterized protein YuzE